MIVLWLGVMVFFWLSYYRFTRGAVTRHIGFLHYVIYFFGIYIGAYQLYVKNGSVDDRFMVSVLLYPALSLLGIFLAQGVGWQTRFEGVHIGVDRRELRLVIWIVLLFLGVYGVYLYSLGGNIPLLGVVMGGDLQASRLARYLATKGYSGEGVGGLRLFFWFPRIMIDYFASFVVVFAYYWATVRGRGRLRFVAIFGGLVVLTLLQVEKYPAIKLFVILALCHFNFKNPRVRFRSIGAGVWLIAGGIFFMGLVYGVVAGHYRDKADMPIVEKLAFTGDLGLHLLTNRGMIGQAEALYLTYELVPGTYDFFGGTTLTNPHGILPYQRVTLPYLVSDYHIVNEPGVQGSDPTVFFGEVYANWGMAASFVAMVLFGFIVQMIHHTLATNIDRIRTTFDVAFFYLVSLWLADFALGFSTIYFDERLWFFVALYMARQWVVRPRPMALSAARVSVSR